MGFLKSLWPFCGPCVFPLWMNRSGFSGGSISWEDGAHGTTNQVLTGGPGASGAAGVRARGGVRLAVGDAAKIGCSAETLRHWVRQAERDTGRRPGLTTEERQRLKDLERENRELKRANEILRQTPCDEDIWTCGE